MSKGYNKNELSKIKKIDVIGYILETQPNDFTQKDNGSLVYKKNPDFVIYKDTDGTTHGFDFGDNVPHPYKDNIGVLQYCCSYPFLIACKELKKWAISHGSWEVLTPPEPSCTNDTGFMFIPDGIDELSKVPFN